MIDLAASKTEWSNSIKLRRVLWTWGLEPLVRWLPKPCSPVRVMALRLMGASVGPHCLLMPGIKVLMPWNLHLEDHVAIGRGVDIYNFALVEIRRQTVVSQDTHLCTGSHDFSQPSMPLVYSPIRIGSGSWVAAGVFVCPGVSVADGVVVGARSVVSKSLDIPWSVYAGNPCVRIKDRTMARKDTP
ncbi:putative colanic acid biosynthesis acetyltransferase [Aquabacterium sp. CECT 9606]|uniref:putative colanic acid biosynthesis acetyltransferase n=1 Tax=Aquabacterium sp. CECT 9606 TaxID=2845822 RepID=UPI001E5D4C97|nr:putative colanic acid biosynthesis acetyltransferase [Aquabacterium sp. CECT 9606]CAH0351564.1 hypothetical protein AQB9606_02226 [Aquabacterium sp. CECT 9606]